MATRQTAEAILNDHADDLRQRGAHSVHVRSGEEYGEKGHVIVAWVPRGFAGTMPTTLTASIKGKPEAVQVKVEQRDPFKVEKL